VNEFQTSWTKHTFSVDDENSIVAYYKEICAAFANTRGVYYVTWGGNVDVNHAA
jgi:hypothetical protein